MITKMISGMPLGKVVAIGAGAGVAFSFTVATLLQVSNDKPETISTKWRAADKDFRDFQKMNPIFGKH